MAKGGKDNVHFPHRHLLGIEGLSPEEISILLDLSETYVNQNRRADKTTPLLHGRTIINLFFEPSTRTKSVLSSPSSWSALPALNGGIEVDIYFAFFVSSLIPSRAHTTRHRR